MTIYREHSGVIGHGACWVCFHRSYLYTHDTLPGLLWLMLTEWNHDRHLIG